MKNFDDFALSIGFTKNYLRNLIIRSDRFYKTHQMKKRGGGFRTLQAPSMRIKAIQAWLLRNVFEQFDVHEKAHGFVKNRGLRTNVKYHLKKKKILCMDIKNFFPSITKPMIKELLQEKFEDEALIDLMAECCCYYNALPQGGVTSPYISNLIFKKYDIIIDNYCNSNDINYSRYADDMAFSSNDILALEDCKEKIIDVLKGSNFKINQKKTRFYSGKRKMVVTGIVVNSGKPTIGRSKKRYLRSNLYNLIIKNDNTVEIKKLLGHLSFLKDIEPDYYKIMMLYKKSLIEKRKRKGIGGKSEQITSQ